AGAVHPGYGFLAENPAFPQACREAGLVFIGPPPEAMRLMGDKVHARALARSLGVPIVPGSPHCETMEQIHKAAEQTGFPLLLKAAGGGGGRGMRKVLRIEELEEAARSAQREAVSAFGDPRLLVERLVDSARHVEVQIVGDSRGQVVALGERECSLQRRYQKIVEEAPSPVVTPTLRARLLDAATRLGEAAGYQNAGTIEFLVGPDLDFFFMEMNTRLQVEHPVTEAVLGVDLVRMQIEVALGLPLSITGPLPPRGHAMEARLYAEDAYRGFLPATGKLLLLRWPHLPGLRVDTGVTEGQEIVPFYDPLLAKVIAWGVDREQARRRLVAALQQTVLLGLTTNQGFLIDLLESAPLVNGMTFTTTVDALALKPPPPSDLAVVAAALSLMAEPPQGAPQGTAAGDDPYSPWKTLGHFRLWERPA
ncbi:MAG: ATP-grasp domain-containing protein, partial [Chloroflexi bacterium]|nr:ATP-grasp domain-containing protein [Chloroflexota bacterium]